MKNTPLILVSNDDGIYAKGLKELVEVMRLFGEVVVIAPENPMSGMSGAISVDKPLRATKVHEEEGYTAYKCTGTPVDCVKLGFNQLTDRQPDFVVSGINHGANSSISVIYSGTLGAAIEGCLHGVPSIGFSICDYDPEADFSKAKMLVARIFQTVIEEGLPHFTCLNVNIPQGSVKGIKVCRQTKGKWVEEFEKRTDPHQRDYYWLSGHFKNFEPDAEDTDLYALDNQYVSVVPINVDMTCLETYQQMKNWNF
ncbi:5'/3'-nucleotidase SurE [Sunxiuqinia sp. A32]|uniref:5'/3'-nucleotidase SurE n=1 Tax=Sunxiuqinia sp. A32 TaxID=3461496 RepID=UPI004046537A